MTRFTMQSARRFFGALAHPRARLLPVLALAWAVAVGASEYHMVIPAGPGGGLDGTAREVGRALVSLGLVDRVSYENVSGGGGGRGLAHFVENAARFESPLMVNSSPLVLRRLQGLFPYGFRDLTPVAAVVQDYGILAVRTDDALADWQSVVEKLRDNPKSLVAGGGSARGSLDHIVLALALEAAGIDARGVRYLPYDGGGKAMLALLGGEVDLLSTGLGETVGFLEAGQARALAVTAPTRLAAIADTPTLRELGFALEFANWRGLFGPPGMAEASRVRTVEALRAVRASAEWQAVLARRGWASADASGDAFVALLEAQEKSLGDAMRSLGFLR